MQPIDRIRIAQMTHRNEEKKINSLINFALFAEWNKKKEKNEANANFSIKCVPN